MAVPFRDVCAHLEARGWVLARIMGMLRVFWKTSGEPIVVPVIDRMVDDDVFERIKEFLKEEDRTSK